VHKRQVAPFYRGARADPDGRARVVRAETNADRSAGRLPSKVAWLRRQAVVAMV
jgi:hypothetical protein